MPYSVNGLEWKQTILRELEIAVKLTLFNKSQYHYCFVHLYFIGGEAENQSKETIAQDKIVER